MFFWRRVAPQIPEEGLKPTATPGYTRNFRDLNNLVSQGKSFSGYERNALFINQKGQGFAEVGGLFDVNFDDDARAVAVMDWDQDGDLDLWVTNRTAPQVRLLRNTLPTIDSNKSASASNSFLAIRLIGNGKTTNRDAIGARLTLWNPSEPTKQLRTIRAGDGFLAQSSNWTHFGLGPSTSDYHLAVAWPGGEIETFSGLKPNSRYTIMQGSGRLNRIVSKSPTPASPPVQEQNSSDEMDTSPNSFWVANQVPFPDLAYRDSAGGTKSTTNLQGKPLLINFWATWCVPCVKELSELAEHSDELASLGATVLALNVDGLAVDRPNGERVEHETNAQLLLQRIGYQLPNGTATQQNLAKMEILIEYLSSRRASLSIPVSVLLDKDGNVAAVYQDAVSWEQLSTDLRLLNADKNQQLARATPRPGRWLADPRKSLLRSAYLSDYATLFATNGFAKESQRLYQLARPGDESRSAQEIYNLAKSATQQRAIQQAIQLYRKAIELDPQFGPAFTGLGAIMLQNNRLTEAKELFERALTIDPNHATALINLAMIDQAEGNNTSALERLQKVVVRNPGYAQAHLNLGSLFASMKRYDDAVRHLSKAIELNPKIVPAHMNLATVYTKMKQWGRAEAAYRRLHQLSPRLASSYYGLGNALAKQQRHSEAVTSYQKAISLGYRNAKTLVQLGLSYRELNQQQASIESFQAALTLDPDNKMALQALQQRDSTSSP